LIKEKTQIKRTWFGFLFPWNYGIKKPTRGR
jgi:hypothetical protein